MTTTSGSAARAREGLRAGDPGPIARPVAIAATIAVLLVSGLVQWVVYARTGHSLGDVIGRYRHWRLGAGGIPYLDRNVEYPVLIGGISYLAARIGRSPGQFALVTGAVCAACAVAITAQLRVVGGGRLWRWILGVPLFLYAFHNWDLIALLPLVAGLLMFKRRQDLGAGALLGLGAAVKLFPGLVVLPLAVRRWCAGDRRGAVRLVVASVAVLVVVDLPVMLAAPRGWLYAFRFQSGRSATWESAWYWFLRLPVVHDLGLADTPHAANALAAIGLLSGIVAICVLAVRRELDGWAIGAATVGTFILTNKVFSPNYDLWLVPFFVVLPIARRVWLAFVAADLGIYTLVIGHFHGLWSTGAVTVLLPWLVVLRFSSVVSVILTATAGAERSTPVSRTRTT